MSQSNFFTEKLREGRCSNLQECSKPIRHRKIVLTDSVSTKLTIENPNQKEFYRARVDGCLEVGNELNRSDWALYFEFYERLVIVELKSTHKRDAVKQLTATANFFGRKEITVCVLVYIPSDTEQVERKKQRKKYRDETEAALAREDLQYKPIMCRRQRKNKMAQTDLESLFDC